MVPFSASAITRASGGGPGICSRTSPLKARSRSSPLGSRRAFFRRTEPMPASSLSVPETSVASIGPRRMSAVRPPRKRSTTIFPSITRTLSSRASAGTRNTTSVRYAGSVPASGCNSLTATRSGVSCTSMASCASPSTVGAVRWTASSTSGRADPSMRTCPMVMSRVSPRLADHVKTRVCRSVAARAGAASAAHTRKRTAVRMGRLYFSGSSLVRLVTFVLCLALAGTARAQSLPSEPISVGNGRFVFGGEFFVTYGSEDPGFFNYNDYEYNALRNVRLSVSTEVRASRHVQALAEIRLEHGDQLSAYALFVRLKPWAERRFDVQLGRVPPTFGAFTKTIYAYNNIVIGQPLAYQYLLSLRSDSVPGTA